MGLSAVYNCLSGDAIEKAEGLYFASTTSPYREKLASTEMAMILNLSPEARTLDIGNSTRAGTSALLAAMETVKAGSRESALVVASDCGRLEIPGGPNEATWGDGAAALAIGKENVILDLLHHYCYSDELTHFFYYTDSADSDPVRDIWQDLHVEGGTIEKWRNGPAIGLTGPSAGGCPTAYEVSRVVEAEAEKADNRRKLTAPPGYESHFAVVFEWSSYEGWAALNGPAPEGPSPCMPAEVTHVWAIANTRDPEQYVAWFAANGQAWRRVGDFTISRAQIDSAVADQP